jgi:hypothetical protein
MRTHFALRDRNGGKVNLNGLEGRPNARKVIHYSVPGQKQESKEYTG